MKKNLSGRNTISESLPVEQELNLAWSLEGRLIEVGGLGGLPPSRMEETSIQENLIWNKKYTQA